MSYSPAPFKRILVPVDFSLRAANALKFAVALGSLERAEVDVLHVWHSDLATPVTQARDRAKAELRKFVAELELRGDVRLGRRTDYGDPYLTIQSVSQLSAYDLIVVAGPEPQRANAASVARDLLGTSPVAVLFVPARCRPRYRSDEVQALGLERILVPLSLAGSAGQAVQRAQSLGKYDGASIEHGANEEDALATVQRAQASRFDLVVVCEPRTRSGERPAEGRVDALALALPCATLSLPDDGATL